MGLLREEQELPKYRTYKLTFENDFDGSVQEIVMKSKFIDGISFNDLLNGFRQFIVALGYSEDSARMILSLNEDELSFIGLSKSDLSIVEFEEK